MNKGAVWYDEQIFFVEDVLLLDGKIVVIASGIPERDIDDEVHDYRVHDSEGRVVWRGRLAYGSHPAGVPLAMNVVLSLNQGLANSALPSRLPETASVPLDDPEFDAAWGDNCPACGQPLPKEIP